MSNIITQGTSTPTAKTTNTMVGAPKPPKVSTQRQAATPSPVLQSEKSSTMTTSPAAPVRKTMTDMGFDNGKIGYSSGKVTYNDIPFISPSKVDNGVAYADSSALRSAANEYLKNTGSAAARAELNRRGVDNGRIGWNGESGMVTIDGEDSAKPQYNINGVSYADAKTINSMTDKAYENKGDPLMWSREYLSGRGYGNAVSWDDESGKVNIGGISIAPVYVSDGKAYVPKSQLEDAIRRYEESNAMLRSNEVTEAYDKRYDEPVTAQTDKLLDREAFDWDPVADAQYGRFKDIYTGLADDAMRRALNRNNTGISGASGAVLAEAMSDRDAYLDKIVDYEQDLRRQSFNEYTGETNRQRDNLADLRTVANDYYNRTYQRERDTYNDMNNARLAERNEEQRQFENQRALRQDALNELLTRQDYDKGNIELRYLDRRQAAAARSEESAADSAVTSAASAALQNIMYKASNRGWFTDDEAAVWGFTKDMTKYPETNGYPLPWAAEIRYNRENQYNTAYGNLEAQKAFSSF